ncbi:MAG: hypothetical protein R3F35_09065 [Myxococcota bacterium]
MRSRHRAWFLALCLSLLAACHGESVRVVPAAMEPSAAPDPRIATAAWAHALLDGAPDEALEGLRPESRALLVRHPELLERVRQRVAALGDVAGLERVVRRDRAALFAPAKPEVEPILLLLDDGRWLIDVVEVEKSYAPAIAGRLDPPRNRENPYRRLVAPPARPMKDDLGEVDLYGEAIEDAIARLGAAEDAASRLRLAEILLRNCWLVDEAMDQYDASIRLQARQYWLDDYANFANAAGVPDRAIPIAVAYDVMSDRVLAMLHQRALRFDKSKLYIDRLTSRTPDLPPGPLPGAGSAPKSPGRTAPTPGAPIPAAPARP